MNKSLIKVLVLLIFNVLFSVKAAILQFEPRTGMTVTIEISNVKELTFNPSSYKILYKRDYNLSPLQVSVTVDAQNVTRDCNTGYYYDGANINMELQSGIIYKFLNNGTFEYKIVGKCNSGWFKHNDGRVRLTKKLGDTYLLSFTMLDFCLPESEGSASVLPSNKTYSIEPFPSVNLYGFVREGVNGRDPKSDEDNFWDPPVEQDDPGNDDWSFDSNRRSRNRSKCETYGRPSYGVNLRALVPGIVDKEYEMTTSGPSLDLTRYHAPGFEGIFGKDWRSSVEYKSIISYEYEDVPGDITIMPGRGLNHTFLYNASNSAFHPVEFKEDTLMITDKQIIWIEGETNLIHYFSKPDSIGISYIDSIGDVFGNKLHYSYNENMQLQSIMDDMGRKLIFEWSNNKVNRTVTPDGRSASYTYNLQDRIEHTYDLEELHTQYAYDEVGNISSFTFEGQTTVFEYDSIFSRCFLKSITDPTGATTSYSASMFPNFSITYVTDPDGNEVVYNYNDQFNISQIKYGNKYNKYSYNEDGLLKTFTRPDGTEINYTYDEKQRLKTASHIYNTDFNYVATETFDYDQQGNMIYWRDALNNIYRYRYDANGLLKSYTAPDNDSIQYTYNTTGRLTQMTHSNGEYTRFRYDNFGNIIEMSDKMGIVFTAEYDLSGQFLRKITDAAGQTVFYTYDNNKRLKTITTPDLQTSTLNYGCCALESQTNSNGQTIYFGRNGLNQLTTISYGNTYSLNMKYDENHLLKEIQGDDGNKTSIVYNQEGMPLNITKPDLSKVEYSYNETNQVETVTDEAGNITRYSYMDQLLSTITDPAQESVLYRYDAAGNKIGMQNSRGMYLSLDYDYNRNITKKTLQQTNYNFRYDYASRLIHEDGPHGFTDYGYDARSNITRINWNGTDSITINYTSGGKITSLLYPDKTLISYNYDAFNRLSKMTWNDQTIDFQYNTNGNLQHIIRSNGWKTHHTFDSEGRLEKISHIQHTDTVIKLSTQYNPNSTVASEGIDWIVLSSISEIPESKTSVYNVLNQIVTSNNQPYTYDADGNLTAIGNQVTASYNTENYITALQTDQTSLLLTYNGMNQVVREEKNGNMTTLYYDQAGRLLFEKNGQGEIIRKYYYVGTYLIAQEYNNNTYFYHYDRQGNTLSLTNTDGQATTAYWFTPFGEKLYESDTISNRFTFLGNNGVIDFKNGYYQMGARCYSSSDGRFLQRDPKGMVDGTNLYAYALNNPVSFKDPGGKDVANGTADLFNCEGPEYLDSDSYDEETAEWLGDVVDEGTDIAPMVGDAKSGIKTLYYLYNGKYKDAAWELANIAGGKYAGSKVTGKMKGLFGDAVSQKTAENIAESIISAIGNAITDVAKKATNNYVPPKRPNSSYDPQVPYIGSRPGRF